MKHLKKIAARLSRAGRAMHEYTAGLWKRLTQEPGCADAAASLVVSVPALMCRNPRLLRFALDTVEALARLARTLSSEPSSSQRWATSDWLLESGWDSEADWP